MNPPAYAGGVDFIDREIATAPDKFDRSRFAVSGVFAFSLST